MKTNAIGSILNTPSVAFQRALKKCECPECTEAGHQDAVRVSADEIASILPNVNIMTPEEKFDKGYKNAIKLTDGSALLVPKRNAGIAEIYVGEEEGQYEILRTSVGPNAKISSAIETISEDELLNNRGYCAGTIKKTKDGTYILNTSPGNGTLGDRCKKEVTKEKAIEFMNKDVCIFSKK